MFAVTINIDYICKMRKLIFGVGKILFVLSCSYLVQGLIISFINSPHYKSDFILINIGEWILLILAFILFLINAIPAALYYYLPLPNDLFTTLAIAILSLGFNCLMMSKTKLNRPNERNQSAKEVGSLETSMISETNFDTSSDYSYSSIDSSDHNLPSAEKNQEKENNITGHTWVGKKVNPETGIIQKKGLFGWVDTDKRINPKTGKYQKEGFFGLWIDTETRVNQESGVVQKEGIFGYTDTNTRINPDTGVIQKDGLLGWVDTDKRIDPETGKSQHLGIFGWIDD